MIGALIGIIITLIVVGVIWWAVQQLIAIVPLPEPFRRVIYVLMVLLMVFIVIYIIVMLLNMGGVHVPVFR